MPEVYTVRPQPVAGQQGSTLIRWLDRYAQAHATAVTQMTVRDFPPWVVGQIDEAVEGDTATTTNFAMVVTLMARLGAAHGLRGVPLAMADAVTLTQVLVLEKALVTLQTEARMGDEAGGGAARLSRPTGGRTIRGPRWPGRPPAAGGGSGAGGQPPPLGVGAPAGSPPRAARTSPPGIPLASVDGPVRTNVS